MLLSTPPPWTRPRAAVDLRGPPRRRPGRGPAPLRAFAVHGRPPAHCSGPLRASAIVGRGPCAPPPPSWDGPLLVARLCASAVGGTAPLLPAPPSLNLLLLAAPQPPTVAPPSSTSSPQPATAGPRRCCQRRAAMAGGAAAFVAVSSFQGSESLLPSWAAVQPWPGLPAAAVVVAWFSHGSAALLPW